MTTSDTQTLPAVHSDEAIPEIPDDLPNKDSGKLGDAMLQLLPRQRKFVVALLETGTTNYTRAAKMAGYGGNSESGLRVQASRLAHDPRIIRALREEGERRLRASAVMATSVLINIAENGLTAKDRLKAAEMILNRTGLHALTEHKTTVEHTTDELGKIERITALARGLGLDPAKLLGQNAAPSLPAPKPVDVEFTEVGSTAGLEDLL